MNMSIRGLVITMMCLLLVSCNKKLTKEEMPVNVTEGGLYYTQVVMHYEKNVYPTTNYLVGAMIPINTPVKLLLMSQKTIDVELTDTGTKLTVKNIEKHTGDDTKAAFNKLFSKQKINLTLFSKLEAEHINSGTVAVGMSKKAVTTAIGYPPITRTASLQANSWVYWRNRFNTMIVNFKNDKVSDIVD